MQRVLSYQTAVRVNHDNMDQRDYVSKRTCVSLVLSVAFCTMICGFLLGKFVSDRHHHIRQLTLEQSRNANANQIKSILAEPALKFIESQQTVTHADQNEQLWREFIGCMQQQNFDYSERLDKFVIKFIDQQFRVLNKCLHSLEKFLNRLIQVE
uniref:CSON007479 protein n=1 Tax=Culicoides sonorensis TaxID=179676 RepID=A0A336MUP7_CULSO